MRPSPLPKFKCRVLIVDDVEDNREMYALYFAYLGWEVRLASNGAEGLAMAQAEQPDILVLDLAMPGMAGWEVCEHLKRDEATRAIKIVVVTGRGLRGNSDDERPIACDAFLMKPCLPEHLAAVIAHIGVVRPIDPPPAPRRCAANHVVPNAELNQ